MKPYLVGFAVATVFWAFVLSQIDIPEYTIKHECAPGSTSVRYL